MGQYFLIANMDRKEYIDPHNFKTSEDGAGFSMKIHHICRRALAGVLPFLLCSSTYYDYMGTWAKDRIIVVGDENIEYAGLFEEIRGEWRDISGEVARSYFEFLTDWSP